MNISEHGSVGDEKTPRFHSTYLLVGQPGQPSQGECSMGQSGSRNLEVDPRWPPAPEVLERSDELAEVRESLDTPKHPCPVGTTYGARECKATTHWIYPQLTLPSFDSWLRFPR